jgi:glycine betaine/proline transport system substrate-binding protein
LFKKSKLIPITLLMALVAVTALACGQPAAAPAPAIDEARLQSIVESAVAKSAPAPAPQVTADEISAMVEKSMMGMSESQVSAEEIQAMVESAVESAAMEGASPEDIQAMVESAVMAASEDAVTAADVQSAISNAVMEAQEGMVTSEDVQAAVSGAVMEASSDALTAEEVQNIVAMALEERAMMEEPPRETIIFGDLNWSSALLQNRIAQYLVEKGYDYPTDVKFGATLPLFQGLQNGDTHVTMEIWLPNQDEAWEAARAEGAVLSVGESLGKDWQSAFVIPKYLAEQYPELDSVEDLKDQQYKDLFKTAETGDKARLVSCIIGWACEEVNKLQITGYGLDEHVQIVNPGDGAALNADLYGAYERQEPWLGYQWGTNDPALQLDLVRLEEPAYSDQCWFTTKACAYEDATILIAVNPDLPARAPEVINMLRQWDFNIDIYKAVVRWGADNPDADTNATAIWWLNSNEDIWGKWVTDDAVAKINAALAAGETPDGWPTE